MLDMTQAVYSLSQRFHSFTCLQEFVFFASPFFPLIDDAAPKNPSVLFQVWQVRGGWRAGHQWRATVAPRATHRPHGFGIGLQQPEHRRDVVKLRTVCNIYFSAPAAGHLFCSSSLASSSSSSGLRFSESAGDAAGAESNVSWEDESGLSTGLPVDEGSASMPGGDEGQSSWAMEPSLSGLLLGMDMVWESPSLTDGICPLLALLSPDWPPDRPGSQCDQRSSNLLPVEIKVKVNQEVHFLT